MDYMTAPQPMPTGGQDWMKYAGYGAMGASALAAILQGLNGGGSTPGAGGYLPGTTDFYNAMKELERLRLTVAGAEAPPWLINAARNFGRQESAVNGIGGALGASVSAGAMNQAQQAFDQQKFDRLNTILGRQSDLALQIRQQEMQQRMLAAQAEAQRKAGQAGTWGTIGSLAGAGLGLYLGGPAGAAVGAPLGGAAGSLGYNVFGG